MAEIIDAESCLKNARGAPKGSQMSLLPKGSMFLALSPKEVSLWDREDEADVL